MNNLPDVMQRLKIDRAFEGALAPHWQESAAACPPTPALLPGLAPEQFRAARALVGLSPDLDGPLHAAAARIAADLDWRLLFHHFCRSLYDLPRGAPVTQWPEFDPQWGDQAGLFYLLAGLAMVPRVQAVHAKLGVPAEVTRATVQQVRCFCDEMHRRGRNGRPGILLNQIYWLRNYTDGRLFRLGRMEYMIGPCTKLLEVWRRKHDGRTLALAQPGLRVDAAGFVLSDDGSPAPSAPEAWRTELEHRPEAVRGFPIHPEGYIERREMALPTADWERVLQPGDSILEMHIPAGGGMPPATCLDSIRQAFEFFDRFFPPAPRAIACHSWILNTQLFDLLPPESNLNRFMRELYLYPIPSGPRAGLFFLFFNDHLPLADAPEDTSVQRAVKQFLLAGNRWRSGGMFFLRDDLPHFGTQHYRSAPRDF
ncbi:MAG: acyltransferase domain-containing protein [Planctomycetota bacterium]